MSGFHGAAAARLDDRDYFDFVLACAESARRRIYASIFLCDVRPTLDVRGEVLELMMALAERRRLGVDVRVLLNGQVRTIEIGVANLATGILLESYGVPHRRVFASDGRRFGSHAKFAIFDDVAVLGSQNWTADGFHDNIEDAVILSGSAVDVLEGEFFRLWPSGRGLPDDDRA